MNIQDRIADMVNEHPVVLFMKGEPEFPMCGFSAQVVQILNKVGAAYTAHNVLEDDDLRQGIKDFADWPTIPQLYVNGDFVGGCDIVTEMAQEGELQQLFRDLNVPVRTENAEAQ